MELKGGSVMFKIMLKPQRSDGVLSVSKNGDALIINGETFDFTQLTEGSTLPPGAMGRTPAAPTTSEAWTPGGWWPTPPSRPP